MTWGVEARVTRAPGDTCQVLPQLLDKAAWVWLCTRWARIGGKPVRAWCGGRHETLEAAREHALGLNMGEVKTA